MCLYMVRVTLLIARRYCTDDLTELIRFHLVGYYYQLTEDRQVEKGFPNTANHRQLRQIEIPTVKRYLACNV